MTKQWPEEWTEIIQVQKEVHIKDQEQQNSGLKHLAFLSGYTALFLINSLYDMKHVL